MALNLDLSESEAKVARARRHFEALDLEVQRIMKGDAYHVRVSDIDKQGWCSAFVRLNNIAEYDLGAIVGDLIHNLRSALNYIVTALLDHCAVTINTKHQFPIFSTEAGFRKRVGTDTSALPGGMLGGITVGLDAIWRLQPFHRKPGPENDPLMGINWLSNADKHRAILTYMPLIVGGQGEWVVTGPGYALAKGKLPPLADWEPDQEHKVGRIRILAKPGTQVRYNAQITVGIHFGTAAFASQHPAFDIDANALKLFCDHVAMIVDLFKLL